MNVVEHLSMFGSQVVQPVPYDALTLLDTEERRGGKFMHSIQYPPFLNRAETEMKERRGRGEEKSGQVKEERTGEERRERERRGEARRVKETREEERRGEESRGEDRIGEDR